MGKFVGALVGVIEIAAGAVLDYFSFGTIGNGLIIAGIGTLLGTAAQLLLSPHRAPVQPIDVNYSGTLEPRRIIYGKMKVGGMHVIPPLTSGNNNDYLHLALALAGHQITGFGDAYLGQTRIANGDIGAVTGSVNDGLVSNTITNNGYQGKVWIRRYNGSQTSVDYILNTTFTVWDSNHKGQGVAYMALQFQYDQKVFAAGLPEPSVFVLGKAVYDPRLDSTNGGSGSQRYNNPATWAYSTNPALCLRDYLTSSLGLNEAQTRIDDALVAAAANICDQTVSVPIPVLVGLTNWSNGSAVVGGVNTTFLAGLNNGQFTFSGGNWIPTAATYVKAPNGSMLQVQSVQSDTQFTLTANYAGATANSQVTQWNNSATTTTLQPRYSCNTVLDCTSRYEDNIAQLARAMMGQCIMSSGKWRMYAGAWSGSAFSLAETDLVGGVSIQTATPRQSLYNAVRGNYINPQKNYQGDEFPPVINTSFATSDGETIYTETNFPCCTDIFECQRNANLLLNFSRDQKIVTAQYGMSAFGVRVWETGTVTIAEVGWVNQTVRCIGWRFNPGGIVELTLQEAYAADWTDPLSTFYVTSGTLVANQPGYYLPYPPTALTTSPGPGGIIFNLTLPAQLAAGTTIQLLENSTSSFSGATVIWQGTQTNFGIGKTDTVTRYYWVRTVGPNGQLSSTYPAGSGVAGTAQTPIQWIAVGNVVPTDNGAVKLGGSGAWGSDAMFSQAGYSNCHIVAKANAVGASNNRVMIALSTAPQTSYNYTNANYAWYPEVDDTWKIYEAGSLVGTFGSASSIQDTVAITYDGSNVRYYLNQGGPNGYVLQRTVAVSGLTLYGFCPFYDPNAGINSLNFGPGTNLAIIDSSNINNNAVSQIGSAYSATRIVSGGGSSLNDVDLISLSVTTTGSPVAVDVACTLLAFTGNSTTITTLNVQVYRDGAAIGSGKWDPIAANNGTAISANTSLGIAYQVTLSVTDAPAAGSHTYTLHLQCQGFSGGTIAYGVDTSNHFIKVREIKR